MVTQQVFLTREGHKRLRDELGHLSTVRRQEIAQYLRQTVSTGEFVGDGDSEDAQNEYALLESRIQALRQTLSQAVVIDEAVLSDTVRLGSHVTILALSEDGMLETYRVVDPAEADPVQGSISYESPLGKQLLGKRAGEEVMVDAPGGQLAFRIMGIR